MLLELTKLSPAVAAIFVASAFSCNHGSSIGILMISLRFCQFQIRRLITCLHRLETSEVQSQFNLALAVILTPHCTIVLQIEHINYRPVTGGRCIEAPWPRCIGLQSPLPQQSSRTPSLDLFAIAKFLSCSFSVGDADLRVFLSKSQ